MGSTLSKKIEEGVFNKYFFHLDNGLKLCFSYNDSEGMVWVEGEYRNE
jgi:hypothetical protein